MKAFHNKQSVKKKYLHRVIAHRKADNIIQGIGWANGKGCAVGCTLEQYNHKAYEKELGIPEWLAKVEDCIFEGLPTHLAKKWPEKFLSAIKPGTDLSKIKAPFVVYILKSNLRNFDNTKYPDIAKSTKDIIALYKKGNLQRSTTWSAARSAAWSAARSAAWSAAESAAGSAAESAARSAARSAAWFAAKSVTESAAWFAAKSAAESAAWSAAESITWSAAWSAAYVKFANHLLKLIKEYK